MIALVDYDTGNLRSVCNALERIGSEYCITSDASVIRASERVLLPGVGAASEAHLLYPCAGPHRHHLLHVHQG